MHHSIITLYVLSALSFLTPSSCHSDHTVVIVPVAQNALFNPLKCAEIHAKIFDRDSDGMCRVFVRDCTCHKLQNASMTIKGDSNIERGIAAIHDIEFLHQVSLSDFENHTKVSVTKYIQSIAQGIWQRLFYGADIEENKPDFDFSFFTQQSTIHYEAPYIIHLLLDHFESPELQLHLVQYALDHGATLNATTINEYRLFMRLLLNDRFADNQEQWEHFLYTTCKILIERGGNLNLGGIVSEGDYLTPLDLAIKKNLFKLTALMYSHGAKKSDDIYPKNSSKLYDAGNPAFA